MTSGKPILTTTTRTALCRRHDGCAGNIVRRHIAHLTKADPVYGQGVAERLGVSMEEVKRLSSLRPMGHPGARLRRDAFSIQRRTCSISRKVRPG